MRSLEARLSRLEKKRRDKKYGVPSLAEYLDARRRWRARSTLSLHTALADEEQLRSTRLESQRKLLENDTPELAARDDDIMRRSEGVHWPTKEERAARAEPSLRKFRAMMEEAKQREAAESEG